MEFGPVPPAEAEGAILAHSMTLSGRRLKKGRVLTAADIDALAAAGVARVTVARLAFDDVGEDTAATRLADALVPEAAGLSLTEAATGRVNLKAERPGVVELDGRALAALNRIDPEITLATLAPYTRVMPDMLVGTVKIISYAVPGARLAEAEAAAERAIRIRPVALESAGLILTEVPGQKASLSEKGRKAMAARLAALDMELADVATVAHETEAVAGVLARLQGDMALILTGSATSDSRDVGPEGVRRAGGRIDRFGMPVDPGNLLFLGAHDGRPVIGLPGCARSPALNGADWVLERIACGIEVTGDDIAEMAVGGLLKEIPSRPQPREGRKGDAGG